ncbi:hypothetical protein KKB18_10115 [bacterium]|nr:hypothetical protein [bacterium]
MNWRLRKSVISIIIFLFFFPILCCKKSDPFGTPQAALRSFVDYYNRGDLKQINKCGVVDGLLNDLKVEDEHAGLIRKVPVMDLQLKILTCNNLRPDLTKRFTTEKAICSCEFTSETDKKFYLKQDILIAKKRHSFQDFSETSRWQIMSVFEDDEDF